MKIRIVTAVSVLAAFLALGAAPMLTGCHAQPGGAPLKSNHEAAICDAVRLFPRAAFASRLVGGQIQGSNEGPTSGFVTLTTISQAPHEGEWTRISFKNRKPYRFLRYFGPAGSYANVAEIEFFSGARKIEGQSYGTFGSRDNSGNDYKKAFDGDAKTFFDAPSANSQYLGINVAGAGRPEATARAGTAAREKGLRHYHIGNSLTDTIGEYTHQIALAAGYGQDFAERQTIPGSPLYLNWQSDGGFGVNHSVAFNTLAPLSDLVMQVFIDNGDSDSAEFSLKFYEAAREKSPDIRPWIYGQWTATGTGKSGSGSPYWEERNLAYMRTYVAHAMNFNAATKGKKAQVIPGGLAMINLKRAIESGRVPGLSNFFASNFADDLHGTSAQRYFIGLVTYSCLYGKTPVSLPLVKINDDPPKLTPEQNRAYQQIAWDTVQQFQKSGGAMLGSLLPGEIDARAYVLNSPPFRGSRVNYIDADRSFSYLLTAPKAGTYVLKVSATADKPGQTLEAFVNHQAAGSLTIHENKDQPTADSTPLPIALKAGLNLLRLHVPTYRPYDLNSIRISPVGQELKNTMPIFDLNVWEEDVKPGERFVRNFKVSDFQTPATGLKVRATSDNAELTPDSAIRVETGEFKDEWNNIYNRRLTVTPMAGQSGEAMITLTLSDADGATRQQSFKLKVK